MKAKTVKELLVDLQLSEREKELHSELIKECQGREERLLVWRQQSLDRLKTMDRDFQTIADTFQDMHRSIQKVNDHLSELLLRRLPASKLPRA